MMRLRLLLLVLIAAAIARGGIETVNATLTNGDFETGDLTGWSTVEERNATVVVDLSTDSAVAVLQPGDGPIVAPPNPGFTNFGALDQRFYLNKNETVSLDFLVVESADATELAAESYERAEIDFAIEGPGGITDTRALGVVLVDYFTASGATQGHMQVDDFVSNTVVSTSFDPLSPAATTLGPLSIDLGGFQNNTDLQGPRALRVSFEASTAEFPWLPDQFVFRLTIRNEDHKTLKDFTVYVDNCSTAAGPGPVAPQFTEPTSPSCGASFDHVAGKTLTFPVAASDPNLGDTVTLTLATSPASLPGTLTFAPAAGNPASGTFAWTPPLDAASVGTYTLTFTASDGALDTDCTMTVNVTFDRDGDGLSDLWETEGYSYGGEFVNLPSMGADPDVPDIFVEIDYMTTAGHDHMPDAAAIATVVSSFAARGINLHVDVDESIPHVDNLGAGTTELNYEWDGIDPAVTYFDEIKAAHFSDAKSLAIHYCVFAHNIPINSGTDSGLSRGNGASDFIVSLGSFDGQVGTQAQQTGTFMHELGHNLGLRHGGGDDKLNKPNYLSVMNYFFQMTGLRKNNSYGHFDYSEAAFPALNEMSLDESIGLNAGAAYDDYGTKWIHGGTTYLTEAVNGPINWNGSGSDTESGIAADINGDGLPAGAIPGDTFAGHDDWGSLNYTGGTIGTGVPLPLPVITPVEKELDTEILEIVEVLADPISRIKGHVADKQISLTWKPAPGHGEGTSYNVHRSEDGGDPELIGTTVEANFHDTNVLPGVSYVYFVTWVDVNGFESQPTADITLELRNK